MHGNSIVKFLLESLKNREEFCLSWNQTKTPWSSDRSLSLFASYDTRAPLRCRMALHLWIIFTIIYLNFICFVRAVLCWYEQHYAFVVLFHGRIAAILCYTLRLVMKQYRGFLAFSGQMESARNTTRYSLCLMRKRRRHAALVYLTNSKETNYIPSNRKYHDDKELNLTLKGFHIYLIKFISRNQLPHFRLILYHYGLCLYR